jgi:hypothetical protein
MSGPTPSVQFAWDGPGALAGGDDGKALCWNNSTGKFVLTAKAAASHTHAPSDLSQGGATSGQVLAWSGSAWVATTPAAGVTDHGALTGLGDDDHSIYMLLAPTTSTRNVIQPTGAAVKALVLKGAASQSANVLEVQNSAGTIIGYRAAAGQVGITPSVNVTATPLLFIQKLAADGPDYPPYISCKNSAGTTRFLVNHDGSITVVEGISFAGTPLISLGGGGTFTIRDGSSQTLFTTTHGSGNAKFQQFSASGVALTVRGATAQTGHLLSLTDISAAIQFAIGAAGKILTNQAVTNTNTPSGATAKALPFYDAAGTLLGYTPLYAAQW